MYFMNSCGYSSSGFSAKQEEITGTDVDMSLILAAVSSPEGGQRDAACCLCSCTKVSAGYCHTCLKSKGCGLDATSASVVRAEAAE